MMILISLSVSSLALVNLILLFLLKVICFILGFLTIFLGYRLICAGASGEFKFQVTGQGASVGLRSVSPGLLFVLLGVGIMAYAIYVRKPVAFSAKQQHIASESVAAPDVPIPLIPREDGE